MAGSQVVVHPRKLYASLLASPSVSERALAALSFLCEASGAERGFLFVAQGGELALAASYPGEQPAAQLVSEVKRVWGSELDIAPDSNRTLDAGELQSAPQRAAS